MLLSIVVCVCNALGCYRLLDLDTALFELVSTHKYFFMFSVLFESIFLMFIELLLSFGHREVIKAWQRAYKLQVGVFNILENSEVAVIS